MKKFFLFVVFILLGNLSAQPKPDTIKGDWPFPPFHSSQRIVGAFAEFRNTQSSDHFHNAVDIPQADGKPCYPSLDGTVYSKVEGGHNAYIRIATKIGSKWKHITYLHINPNPSLSIGDKVKKGETVIGTVVTDMGHVHLIERELVSSISNYGYEINNLRKNGGLTPFVDTWAPVIEGGTLKFFRNASSEIIDADNLHGKVDIRIKIRDIHGSGTVASNNGTYIAGYRIWDEAKNNIVYEPDDNGVKYRFDWKPKNAYVHNAYAEGVATLSNPVYWLTNGNGANEINSSKVVNDNYFDASVLPGGKYQLEIFSEDTRENKTNKFFPITITDPKPDVPLLYAACNTDNKQGLKIIWKKNEESDIKGYRLYYSVSDNLNNWELAADETKLTATINEYQFSSPSEFIVPPSLPANYFTLVAVDRAGQESDKSDVLARSDIENNSYHFKALIVNGFDLKNKKGKRIGHQFVQKYFSPLASVLPAIISSISHKVFIDNIKGISLDDYDFVLWFTGDNTNHTTTIVPREMSNIAMFLEKGKPFFISGAKIGYDLDERRTGLPDTLFYFHYLKSEYYYVGDDSMTPAAGKENTVFNGVELNYVEKYPDDINPVNGSEVLLKYNSKRGDSTYRNACVGYKGKFGKSNAEGKMVYLAFPFESVASAAERELFIQRLIEYFEIVIEGVDNKITNPPDKFVLAQNYPNPFNPSTTIKYSIPANLNGRTAMHVVTLTVYDILGRQVATLVNKKQSPGNYQVSFSSKGLSSGIYLYKLQYNGRALTKKMILLK
jgi:hypothetical protein